MSVVHSINLAERQLVWERTGFSYLCDRICSIFSGAGKFRLAHRLKQLTRNVNSDVRIPIFRSDVTFAPPRKTSNGDRKMLCDVKCQK